MAAPKESTTESDSSPNIKLKYYAIVALQIEKMSSRPQQYQCLASAKARLLFKSGQTTDDAGWNDFGCYSGGGAGLGYPTPNIDRIAKEGAVFANRYGQASCNAGRAPLLTGRLPTRSASSIVVATKAACARRSSIP